ncbi:MAG: FlgD immunoglobulin-like domain containing protein [Bacillota bacterium]
MGRFFFSSGQFLRVATGIFGFSLFGLLCWVTTAVAAQNIICVSINPFAVNSAGNVDVRYYLSTTDAVYATVYDKLGNKIVDLLTGTVTYPPGLRSVRWSQPNPGANGFYDIVLCTTQSQVNVSGEVYFDNVAPSITVSVYTATFNPLKGEALEAKYLLSENARVTVRVVSMKDATTIDKAVATLLTNACETGGVAHDVYWDGRDSGGNYVTNGLYALQFFVTDLAGNKYISGSNQYYLTPTVTLNKENGPDIVTCTPPLAYFAPDASGKKTHRLSFTLREPPQEVCVSVYDASGWVTDVVYGSNFRLGANSISWDGKAGGSLVSSGTYYYYVHGQDTVGNSFGAASAWFRVDSTAAAITGNPPSLSFTVKDADGYNYLNIPCVLSKPCRVTVQVLDSSGRLVNTLLSSTVRCGPVSAAWDGRNASGSFVSAGTYQYRISATDLSGVRLTPAEGTITVN